MNPIEAYPLNWPAGWKRTAPGSRRRHTFRATLDMATRSLRTELVRLKCDTVVISTNVPLRLDGLPRADYQRSRITDPGAAVYFLRKGKRLSLACDKYDLVEANLRALSMTVGAMRTIERHGTELLERSFSGFLALPPGPSSAVADRDWFVVLNIDPVKLTAIRDLDQQLAADMIERQYKECAKTAHPDHGGSVEAFNELQRARDNAYVAAGVQHG